LFCGINAGFRIFPNGFDDFEDLRNVVAIFMARRCFIEDVLEKQLVTE
jgi:hypothetical protein